MPPQHKNTMFTGDNLPIMQKMKNESIDLIATDPPFNSNRNYQAPTQSHAKGAAFQDIWPLTQTDKNWLENNAQLNHPKISQVIRTAISIHSDSMGCYLIMMAQRLIEMHRILKPTGSLYLHCDQSASHYLRLILDAIFSKNNFKNDIIWSYDFGGRSKNLFPKKHDNILFYTKSKLYTFNTHDMDRTPYTGNIHKYRGNIDAKTQGKLPTDVWQIPIINTMAKERTKYPTQKPLALYNRIIKASSNEGDIVLDPFCGCATTCIAAEQLNRKWLAIDRAEQSYTLLCLRLKQELNQSSTHVNHVIQPESSL